MEEDDAPSLRLLLTSLDLNVFLFFRVVTQMYQSAGKEAWFAATVGDVERSEKDFKQLEAHFIILVILFAKYRKVPRASSPLTPLAVHEYP